MITFFTTPKPFAGHIDVIQRNAIRSWLRIHPDVEVILFGDDCGAAEAARDLGIRHEPEVKRNDHGTKFLAPFFDRAQEIARHDVLCYVNCDILLLSDFRAALEQVLHRCMQFLMIGRRWDTDVTEPLDFSQSNWEASVRQLALAAHHQRPPQWIDYFVFSRGLYRNKIPRFLVGRPGWDNWLVWFARDSGVSVVDASEMILAVHQNHDYSYHPEGEKGVWEGEEAQKNYALLDGDRCFRTIENATHRLTPRGLRKNYHHYTALVRRRGGALAGRVWFSILNVTRPVRHRLGLRAEAIPRAESKRQ